MNEATLKFFRQIAGVLRSAAGHLDAHEYARLIVELRDHVNLCAESVTHEINQVCPLRPYARQVATDQESAAV